MEEEEDVLKMLIQDSYEDDELNFEIDPDVEENLLKEPEFPTSKDTDNKPKVLDEKRETQSESDQIENVKRTDTFVVHENKNFKNSNQRNVPKRPFNDNYKDNSNRNAKKPRNISNNQNPELFKVNANIALRLPNTKLIKDALRFPSMPPPLSAPNLSPFMNPIGFYPDRYPQMNNMPMLNNNYPLPNYQQPRQLLSQPPLFPTFPPLNPFNPPPVPGMNFRDNLCQFSPSSNPMPFRPNPGPLFNQSFNSVADPYSYHQEMNNVSNINTNLNHNNHNFSNFEPNRDHSLFNKNAPLLPLPNAFNHPTVMNYPAPKMPTPLPAMLNNSQNSSTRMNINPRHSFRPNRQNLNVNKPQFNIIAGNKPNLTIQQNPSSKPQKTNTNNNPVNNQRNFPKPQQPQFNKKPQPLKPRIFNNPNPNNSSNIIKVKEMIEDKTLEIDDDYLRKLEEQKKLRAKIAEEKEQKRKILQLVCSNDNTKDLLDGTKTQIINRPVPPLNPIKKQLEQSAIKPVVEKIGGLKKLSKEVRLSGFTKDIRESVLRKLARPYGMVETIVISNDKRCATIKFTQLNDAQKFVDQCEIDSVFEKNDEINAKITIAFNWFVSKIRYFF